MLIQTKKAKQKQIMRDVVLEELEGTCKRIVDKTFSLKEKLGNGGGEAIAHAFTLLPAKPNA